MAFLKFKRETAVRIAWVVFGIGCLLVLAFIWWLFRDGVDGAMGRFYAFGDGIRYVIVNGWSGTANFLTVTINTMFGSFTGVDYVAMNIGHWVLVGLIVFAVIFAIFWAMMFRD